MTFTKETAAEAGAKGGQIRRRRRSPNDRARAALLQGAAAAAGVVVAVAAGSEGFEDAKPELRFKAATIILEYVLGKPVGLDEPQGEESAPEPVDLFGSLLANPEVQPEDEAEDEAGSLPAVQAPG